MIELVRICGVGIIGGMLAIMLRRERYESALVVTLVTSVIIGGQVVLGVGELLSEMNNIIAECGVDIKYFSLCVKAVGLAYVSQLGAEILRDAGEGAIASKVEAAGKISILLLTMPVITSFLRLCLKAVNSI